MRVQERGTHDVRTRVPTIVRGFSLNVSGLFRGFCAEDTRALLSIHGFHDFEVECLRDATAQSPDFRRTKQDKSLLVSADLIEGSHSRLTASKNPIISVSAIQRLPKHR